MMNKNEIQIAKIYNFLSKFLLLKKNNPKQFPWAYTFHNKTSVHSTMLQHNFTARTSSINQRFR